MKQRFGMVLTIVMIASLSLAACVETVNDGESTDDAEQPAATETATPDDSDETVAEGDTSSDDSGQSTDTPAADEPTSEPATDDATPDASPDPSSDASSEDTGNVFVFEVSNAGEVEIEREGDELRIVSVTPNEGWDYREDYDDDDDLEVEFRQSNREVEIEAEIENGRLKIEIEDDWDDAEDGTYFIGPAGEVEFERTGDELNLIEVRPAEDWDYRVDDDDDNDEIEVDFRNGPNDASFEAEVDDGRLEVDIDIEFYVEELG